MRRSEIEALLAAGIKVPRGEYDRDAQLSTDSSSYLQNLAKRRGETVPPPPTSGQTPSSWGQVSREESLAKGLRMPTAKDTWDKKRGKRKKNYQFPDYPTWQVRDAEMENAYDAMAAGNYKYGGTGSYASSSPERYELTKNTLQQRFGGGLKDTSTPEEKARRKKDYYSTWKDIHKKYPKGG